MKASLRAYLYPILVAGLLMAGCSQESKGTDPDMRDRIETDLGAVEKVTVMSTDGQEVMLDLPVFLKELPEQGKDLQISPDLLEQEDVRFTLVLYRRQLAPLVVSVGEKASQYGESTYRGIGAVHFYQWIRSQTGKGLLAQQLNSVLLSADDLSQTRVLGAVESGTIKNMLDAAVPETDQSDKQYPLHPYYRMRINSTEKPLEVTVLTPTLLSVPFGRERLSFHVEGKLFSQLTEWLPPAEMADDSIEPLFKSTRIRLETTGGKPVQNMELDVIDTTVEQGIAHQAVRLLKTGVPLTETPKLEGSELYRLQFLVNGKERTVVFYPRHFRVEKAWYLHSHLEESVWKLLEPTKK